MADPYCVDLRTQLPDWLSRLSDVDGFVNEKALRKWSYYHNRYHNSHQCPQEQVCLQKEFIIDFIGSAWSPGQ